MAEFEDTDDDDNHRRMPYEEKDYTLVFCRRLHPETGEKQILLGMKKRGFGQGRWNGFGGKLETDEDIIQCAKRELQEECGLAANDLTRTGYVVFKMLDIFKIMCVHIFQTRNFTGDLIESDEMRPQWYNEDEIPFEKMWADDPLWFPYLLEDKSVVGRCTSFFCLYQQFIHLFVLLCLLGVYFQTKILLKNMIFG
jgi:8-oxo-dGTP diphosphatase/2-hydroxy-dATP diphosphatase